MLIIQFNVLNLALNLVYLVSGTGAFLFISFTQSLAEMYGVQYVETSCKATETVEDLFRDLVKIILRSTIHPIPSVPKSEDRKPEVNSGSKTHRTIIPDQKSETLKPVVRKEEYKPER